MSREQADVVTQLVHGVARSWAGPMPADCQHMNPLPERLDGVIHNFIVQLEGYGGIRPHRLSAKGDDVDLLDLERDLRYATPLSADDRAALPADAVTFADRVWAARNRVADVTAATGMSIPWGVGEFIAAVLDVVEDGYVLVPQYHDDEGEFLSEGADISPGSAAAFRQAWAASTWPISVPG